MWKISLSYPDTWLTISISVKNRDTWVEDFSGTMTEVGTTGEYKYDFTEVSNTDYVYVATVSGYSNMSGVIYRDGGWLTATQDAELTQIYNRIDLNLSEVAVWWNPYIEWVNWLKKWIQKIIDKVEDKWEEIIKEIEESEKDIIKAIPEQKEPILNITTEKIDTEQFMKAIKDIPAPVVNVTTEHVSIDPIITEIKAIGKIKDIKFPEYPEQKEMDMSWMEKCMEDMGKKIESIPDNTQSIRKIEEYISKIEEKERNEEKMKEEEEMMNRPLPNSFTATLK